MSYPLSVLGIVGLHGCDHCSGEQFLHRGPEQAGRQFIKKVEEYLQELVIHSLLQWHYRSTQRFICCIVVTVGSCRFVCCYRCILHFLWGLSIAVCRYLTLISTLLDLLKSNLSKGNLLCHLHTTSRILILMGQIHLNRLQNTVLLTPAGVCES